MREALLLGAWAAGALAAHRFAFREWHGRSGPRGPNPPTFEGFLAAIVPALFWPAWVPLWLLFRATYGRRREDSETSRFS